MDQEEVRFARYRVILDGIIPNPKRFYSNGQSRYVMLDSIPDYTLADKWDQRVGWFCAIVGAGYLAALFTGWLA